MSARIQTSYIPMKLPEIVGKGYATFWNWKGRYRVCKGSRASKKSKTTALWFIYNIMKYNGSNALVIRKVYRSLKDSCFSELIWAINRLGVSFLWDIRTNPLELTYLPTGQKILFRGLDDPLKTTSITVTVGKLTWLWIEEAYEIMSEQDFDVIDESIRGEIDAPLFKQVTLTFNPWNERHWLKSRFFDKENPEVLAMTTNYTCNEWLDKSDLQLFENMKINNPRRYQVAGLGNWGVSEGLVYENWKEKRFSLAEIQKECSDLITCCGLDFGYTNDPSAFIVTFLDRENKKLFVFDEFYQKAMSNRDIYNKIEQLGYRKEQITADSAEPKSIAELDSLGLHRIRSAKKGADSINNGIQWIQDLQIIIHPRCTNFITEISNYCWDKDKFGQKLNKPIDSFNHLMDAMRYALEEWIVGSRWLY